MDEGEVIELVDVGVGVTAGAAGDAESIPGTNPPSASVRAPNGPNWALACAAKAAMTPRATLRRICVNTISVALFYIFFFTHC